MQQINPNHTYGIIQNHANSKILEKLNSQNVKLIEFPFLEHKKCLDIQNAQELVENINKYDWLIFTDVLSVECFLEIVEEQDFDLFELDNLRICSCGESVSDQLRFVQIHSDVIPNKLNPDNIFNDIRNYIADEKDFKNSKFLQIRGKNEILNIRKNFIKDNVLLDDAIIYKFFEPEKNVISRLQTLLIGGAVDEFIVNTPKDYLMLNNLFCEDKWKILFSGINFITIDISSFQFLNEMGLKPQMFALK